MHPSFTPIITFAKFSFDCGCARLGSIRGFSSLLYPRYRFIRGLFLGSGSAGLGSTMLRSIRRSANPMRHGRAR
jgi:hypothetical protein